jgi:hypothetical protein
VVEHGLFAPEMVSLILIAGEQAASSAALGAKRERLILGCSAGAAPRGRTSGGARTPSSPIAYAPIRSSGGE